MDILRRKISRDMSSSELTLLIFGIIAFMYFTGEILKPLALSVLLSFALTPAARLFERLGLPRAGAVVLTVVIVLGLVGGIGYIVGQQVASLANRLPDYQENIETKLRGVIKSGQRLNVMVDQVTARLEKPRPDRPGELAPIQKVQVVEQRSFQDQLRSASGRYLEYLGIGGFVLVLVLFMLVGREDLRDRIVGLFGHREVGLTTRTMEEIGRRISRYLATLALVNSGFGLVIGVGLTLIGLPYAVLWGCLAAMLRFIPYVGTAVALALPLVFSFANFPGWIQPLEVVTLFGAVELALNSFVEPVLYGKTTGVSALGLLIAAMLLLIAAMFWTWLWGTPGLLLSTPLTVCLVVLGKHVPSLGFFAILLGEKAEVDPDEQFYQRLVALDRAGAKDVVEAALKVRPRVDVFDHVLIPTLSRSEHDVARGDLDESEQAFIWDVIGDVVDRLRGVEEFDLASASRWANGNPKAGGDESTPPRMPVVGIAVENGSDALVLQMLRQLLTASGLDIEVITDAESPLEVAEQVAELSPRLVVVSHLAPRDPRPARYLVRRLRARFTDLEIVVGRWGETTAASPDAERLVTLGASQVVFTLADLRDRILGLGSVERKPAAKAAPLPA
ncbi:MAG: AI-2E family transporter [Isosphaeraceae bacterium]